MSRLKPVQPFPHMLELDKTGFILYPPFPPRAGARQWNPAAPLALKYRRYYQSPQLTLTSIRAFSNHSVFSGLASPKFNDHQCIAYNTAALCCRQVTEVSTSSLSTTSSYSHALTTPITSTAMICLHMLQINTVVNYH